MEKPAALAFQYGAGQPSGGIGSRIHPDAIRAQDRLSCGGVAMNNNLPEIGGRAQKFLADAHQILGLLPGERQAGPYACMDEEVVSNLERQLQAVEKIEMCRRE